MAWHRLGDKPLSETNAGPIHWRIYAAVGGDELTHWDRNKMDAFSLAMFKRIFSNENTRILIKISLKFFPKVRIINIPLLF